VRGLHYLALQEIQRVDRLPLRARREVPGGQHVQEVFDIRSSQIPGVAPSMEQDEPAYPVPVGLGRPPAVVAAPARPVDLLQQQLRPRIRSCFRVFLSSETARNGRTRSSWEVGGRGALRISAKTVRKYMLAGIFRLDMLTEVNTYITS